MRPSFIHEWIYFFLMCVMRLPWCCIRLCARCLAWLWLRTNARESRVAYRNIELAFPELALPAKSAMRRAVLRSTAQQTAEILRVWTHPSRANLRHIRYLHGTELFSKAMAQGRGVIIAAPHFGNWELLNQWLASQGPITILYRPSRSPILDAFLQRVRGIGNVRQVKAEAKTVRQLFKVLKDGGTVGILPDQQPKLGDGAFAPFFGVQAFTMTLLSRLAHRTHASVLFGWCERVNADFVFDIHFATADPAIAHEDPGIAAAALNAGVEQIARRDPTQYQWTYKRFTLRPLEENATTNPYATSQYPH